MKIVSWNVAGFRACQKKGFEDFFKSVDADVFCLQETKVIDSELTFRPDGYKCYLYPAEKKGYSGTMIYSKIEPLSIKYGIDDLEYDSEGRTITVEYNDFYLVNVYVPNVKRDLSRMESRMRFQDVFVNYMNSLDKIKPVIVCGDMNVAHEEIDIRNVKSNIGNAGFTYEERGKMTELLNNGYIDTFRYYHPNEAAYSWWSYMANCRAKDIGWRIDYFICSKRYIDNVIDTMIYKEILGSDHCPIGIEVK